MKKYNLSELPITQIWTDMDLAKFAMISFIAGIIVGWLI